MDDVSFFQTRAGRQFYEVTVPELVRQLSRLNDLLALGIELAEHQVASSTVNSDKGKEAKKP